MCMNHIWFGLEMSRCASHLYGAAGILPLWFYNLSLAS